MWNSVPQLHAALNDFPPALFVVYLVFAVAAYLTKKDSLRGAAYWSLVAAAVGAVFALVTGLRAEGIIEHGSAMHRSIERHETLAIAFTVVVVGLAAWSTWRRGVFNGREGIGFAVVSVLGLLGVMWTSSVGGKIVFNHAGGIETRILQASLTERESGHAHAPGTEAHEHAPDAPEHDHPEDSAAPADAPAAADHEHAPDTPEHSHDSDADAGTVPDNLRD